MKRFITPALIALCLLITGSGYSQAISIDKQFNLQLTQQMIEQGSVVLDISSLSFTDEAAAVKFFRSVENNLFSFEVDFASKTATILIHADRLGSRVWSLEQWNDYLVISSKNCADTYQLFTHQ
jgi:hypothetical protein